MARHDAEYRFYFIPVPFITKVQHQCQEIVRHGNTQQINGPLLQTEGTHYKQRQYHQGHNNGRAI